MRIVDVSPGALLDAVYTDVLAPAFPPTELSTVDALRDSVANGDTSVVAFVDMTGAPWAAAVGDWSPETGVALLSHLAVRRNERATGLGGRLLEHVVQAWRQRWQPCLILAEIEHPAAHSGSDDYGDPWARIRFYGRHHVRPLAVPYFQPSIRRGAPRVYGLTLSVVAVADPCRGPAPDTVDGDRVARWLTGYLESAEGGVGTDPATEAVFAALRRPEGVPMLSFDDVALVPYSTA
jgi:GNAT superfamily N-acetyltransferase